MVESVLPKSYFYGWKLATYLPFTLFNDFFFNRLICLFTFIFDFLLKLNPNFGLVLYKLKSINEKTKLKDTKQECQT